jgi:hypothetical protein
MVRSGKLRRGLGAAVATLVVAATAGSVATLSHSEQLDDLLPNVHAGFAAEPAPIPVSSEGRIPVSLRLTDSIWTDDGSHPSAATQLRFEFDRSFRLDLSGVARCSGGIHSDIRTEVGRCAKAKFASGKMKVRVAFPEQGTPIVVAGDAIAYKANSRKVFIRAYLPAPITSEISIPVTVGRSAAGAYGVQMTATVPKLAGGFGSLVYLGLRFRKGPFSVACADGHLHSRVTNSLADEAKLSVTFLTNC